MPFSALGNLCRVPFMFRHAYTPSMSYKHIGTAADLVRFGCSLRIECGECCAANTMSATEVVRKCGSGDLGKIKRRLKCARCGARAAQLVVLPPL
jgi:ribosomal protein L40E